MGGNYNNGTNAGPFYLNGNNAPSNTNSNLGSRLLIPYPKLRVVFSSPLGENFAAGTRPSKPDMDLKGREVNKKNYLRPKGDHSMKNTKRIGYLIKKFYPSLSPREVMRFLRRKIKDEAFLGLIWRIIKDGIKIGFYISQWLANAVLEPLDHYIREKLGDGVRHYVRYIDNLTIFGHNKKKLHRAIRSIMEFLGRMGLRLKENWQLYNTRKRMVNAVGYRYKRGLTLIRKKNLLRLKRQCTRARKRIAAHRKIAPIQARGILSRSGQLKHCAGWSLYDKHVRPIEKTIKSVVREASRKERILCSST